MIVNGTAGPDSIKVAGGNGAASVTGLAATVNIAERGPGERHAHDQRARGRRQRRCVAVSRRARSSSRTTAATTRDVLTGSTGNDLVNGGTGNDIAFLGAGDDTFVWNPGDGSDTVEGQAGTDTMLFNGANVNENIDLSANGNRLRLFRDVANDHDGHQRRRDGRRQHARRRRHGHRQRPDRNRRHAVNVDLAGTVGGGIGDGQADNVIVNGTNGDDAIDVGGAPARERERPRRRVRVLHSEVANDRLEINTLAGTDTVTSAGLVAGAIQLFVDGVPVL